MYKKIIVEHDTSRTKSNINNKELELKYLKLFINKYNGDIKKLKENVKHYRRTQLNCLAHSKAETGVSYAARGLINFKYERNEKEIIFNYIKDRKSIEEILKRIEKLERDTEKEKNKK